MNKMAEAMANSNTCDVFTESRKLRGRNNNLSKTIVNLFGKKYDEPYNSVF